MTSTKQGMIEVLPMPGMSTARVGRRETGQWSGRALSGQTGIDGGPPVWRESESTVPLAQAVPEQ